MRRGDSEAAEAYAAHHRITTLHPATVAQQVARIHATVTARGERLAITTSSAGMARAINLEIQYHRHLGHPAPVEVALADGTTARVGDQIATRRNTRLRTDRGVTVRNRHTWTVVGVDPDGSLVVTHPDHGTVTLPGTYVADAVELGWAVTGYGNQGITTDHSLTVIEPGSTRAGIYVGLTRGRGHNLAVIIDPTGTADPTDTLTQAIARPTNATTAHALRARLYSDHGLEPPAPEPPTPPAPARDEPAHPDPSRPPVRRSPPALGR